MAKDGELDFFESFHDGAYADAIHQYTAYYNQNRILPQHDLKTTDDWVSPGNINQIDADTSGITLDCDHGIVTLQWYGLGCLKVTFRFDVQAHSCPSVVTAIPKPIPYTISETDNAIRIQTDEMICDIQKQPFHLTMKYHEMVILQDKLGPQVHRDGGVRLGTSLQADESCYGLGERATWLNRRSQRFAFWNTDQPDCDEGTDPLYYNVPFYLGVHANGAYGIYIDNSSRGIVDVGTASVDELLFQFETGELAYYVLAGPTAPDVLKNYGLLTGFPPLLPLWFFGYHQSRFSYASQDEVLSIAERLRNHQIPCDAIYLDIDYMQDRTMFTWHSDHFPSPRSFISQLHEQGYRVVPILDPAIKKAKDHPPYENGIANDVFLKDRTGQPLNIVVWSGVSHLPDFTRQKVREWWRSEVQKLLDLGIDGFWNDMNEPAVFADTGATTLPETIEHHPEGYLPVSHQEAHNLYAYFMARATYEAMETYTDKRPVNITRAGFAGSQRYAAMWTGDITSSWDHLRLSIPMLLNMGLSGVAYAGADVGGFRGDTSGELLTRWTQAASMTPYFRNHSAIDTTYQEPWQFGEPYLAAIRLAIETRYRLMPYIYSVAAYATTHNTPMMRPLFFLEPNNSELHQIDDAFLLGDCLLVAPILTANAKTRILQLPKGLWYDFWSHQKYEGGQTITIDAPLDKLPLFVRGGSVLPMWELQQHFNGGIPNNLSLHIYPGELETSYYEDAGQGRGYQNGEYRWIYYTTAWFNNRFRVQRRVTGRFEPPYEKIKLKIMGFDKEPLAVKLDRQGAPIWYYEDQIIELSATDFKQLEITRFVGPSDKTVINRPWL